MTANQSPHRIAPATGLNERQDRISPINQVRTHG